MRRLAVPFTLEKQLGSPTAVTEEENGWESQQALGQQASTSDRLLLPPPLRETEFLFFSSKKIAHQDLSQENYGPAYYKADVLRGKVPFPSPSPVLSLQLLPPQPQRN